MLYVATGNPYYLEEAAGSITCLLAMERGTRVALLSDLPGARELGGRLGVRVGMVRTPPWVEKPSRHIKTLAPRLSPFRETLMLDTDIMPLAPWGSVWSHLRDGRIGAVPDEATLGRTKLRPESPEYAEMLRTFDPETVMFNAGALLWRQGPEVSDAFDRWHREWRTYGDVDQFAMVRARMPIDPLPSVFNDQQQDSADAAHARGAVFWHHWSAKPPPAWTPPARKLRWVRSEAVRRLRGAAAAVWRATPILTPPVRWFDPDS